MAGKEYTIVVLSSSPPAPDASNSPDHAAPSRRVVMPPSSPFTLSPPVSPKKHGLGALASSCRAAPIPEKSAPIPEKSTRGFATVSSLVRAEHFAQQMDEDLAEIQQAQQRRGSHKDMKKGVKSAKRPTTRTAKKAAAAYSERPESKPKARKSKTNKEGNNSKTTLDPELRLPRATRSPFFDNAEAHIPANHSTEPVAGAVKLTKSGRPRKPRTKKEKLEVGVTEAEPESTRVTKAHAVAEAGKASREAADDVSAPTPVDKGHIHTIGEGITSINDERHRDASIWDVPQSPQSKQFSHKQRRLDILTEGLDLEEAVLRRREWTPPRDTSAPSPSTISTGKENRPSSRDAMTGTFTHLISNFTYESPTGKVTNNATTSMTSTSTVTKRRRVEPVEPPGVQTTSRASSPEKSRAPKKKPRTITDLVTGQYAAKDTNSEAQAVTSDFFSPRTNTTKVPLNDDSQAPVEAAQKKPQRKRSKPKDDIGAATSKAKPRARKLSTKSTAKPKPVVEKLLSPTSAVSRMNRQDVLFGTSSQLALEESPTTVRQIQLAIKESEQDERNKNRYSFKESPRWPKLHHVEGKRGLWRESTRDSDGGLLEDMENVYIPEPDRTQDLPLLMDTAREKADLPTGFEDIGDFVPSVPIAISSDLPTPPESQSQIPDREATPARLLSEIFDHIDDFNNGLPPSNQNAESQTSFADIDDFQPVPLSVSHQALPDVLKPPATAPAAVAAAGSPTKRRGRPPKVRSALPVLPASAPSPARKPSSPRQRPQPLPCTPPKVSSRFDDIEEILDSEDEVLEAFSPTPPRLRKLGDSPPLPLTFREPSDCVGRQIGETAIMPISRIQTSRLEWANIKPSICAAITAHIRSIPPTADPKKPSWHEKILMYDPIVLEDLTAYLNSNTSLRTYRRATQKQIKAYNSRLKMQGTAILGVERDDQVLAIEKELEIDMVRDWCQEMSICCIRAKESRGRGSARKGYY
ncbi:AT hook domain-containing protein [Stagonosporopsis vannaccii]|nr:AT hook domain-containing protein [Stagonosporopsis vannaccii]